MRYEEHQQGHRDQVDGNYLPGCLQNLRVDIEALRQRLGLLFILPRNSVKHVGIHKLTLNIVKSVAVFSNLYTSILFTVDARLKAVSASAFGSVLTHLA